MLNLRQNISRRVFESPPQRGFARHLLCDIGAISEQGGAAVLSSDEHKLLTVLGQWRWQPPPPVYCHEQLPRPLHLISASPPRRRHDVEEHLLAASLDWSCDTFCAPTMQAVDMIACKSLALLQIIEQSAASAQFFIVGTANPHDVYVLLGVQMFSRGIFSAAAYRRYLHLRHERGMPPLPLPAPSNKNIAMLLIPRPERQLLSASNPLNHCLTVFDDAAKITELLLNPPSADSKPRHRWQHRNEHDIIDFASELLDL